MRELFGNLFGSLGVFPIMSDSPQTNMQNQLGAQQAAALSNLGGLGNAAPRPPTNLEEAIQKCHRLIENHGGLVNRQAQLIDRINGPCPEREQIAQEAGQASGQLSELHRLLDIIDNQTRDIANQLDTIDGTI